MVKQLLDIAASFAADQQQVKHTNARGEMNGESDRDAVGNKMAERIATGIATLIGVAVMGAGVVVWELNADTTELAVKCSQTREELFDLHQRLYAYPSAAELGRCSSRLEELERHVAVDLLRMERLEAAIKDLTSRPAARPDPFTGTEGRVLRERIEALEGVEAEEHKR